MIGKLCALLPLNRSPRRAPPQATYRRPCLEVLEDRAVPSSVADSLFPPQNGVSLLDRLYLIHEAQGDQQEAILGQVAMQNASSPAVKLFGFILKTDHLNALHAVTPVLQSAGLPLPPLSQQNLQNIQLFTSLSGQQFDDQFTSFMVQDHVAGIVTALAEEQAGMNAAIKNFAAQSIPVLDTHLLIALALQPGGQAANSSHG